MEFRNIPLWDIFKCLTVIFLMTVAYVKGDELIDKIFRKPVQGSTITAPQIARIAENLVQVQNIANQKRFDSLMKQMRNDQSNYAASTDGKIRDALKAAEAYAKASGAQITTLGQTVAQLDTSFKETIASINYVDEEVPTRSYEDYDLKRTMPGGVELPVGWVKYHPDWKDDDKLVQYHYPLEYYTRIIRSQNQNGTFAYHTEAWIENNFVKSSKGIKYPVRLKDVQFEERPLTVKSWSFNPRLGLGAVFSTSAFCPALDLSMFSYGKTNVDMDWRFLTVGIGATGLGSDSDTSIIGVFTPVQYNLGKVVPFIENFFIGPTVSVSTESTTGYGATASIPF